MRRIWIVVCLLALGAGAWDVEHDEVAMLTGEFLPKEMKSFFDFDDFDILLSNCHYPDMSEWPRASGKRECHSLAEITEKVGLEDAQILADQGYKVSGWLHTEQARAVSMALLARAFAKGEHARAAFYLSELTHAVADESALNHPPLLQFVQYSRFEGVDYAVRKVEPGSKNIFGFRSDGYVVHRAREKLHGYVPRVPAGDFASAVFHFVSDAARQAAYAAEKEGLIAFAPRAEGEEALADLVVMQVRVLLDMAATCWHHRSPTAALPSADFGTRCKAEKARISTQCDPGRQAVFAGIFDGARNPVQTKGVVGIVCEPYAARSGEKLSFVGRMLLAAAGRTLRDAGWALRGIPVADLATRGLPAPTEVGTVMISLGPARLTKSEVQAFVRYRQAGGKLIVVGGADPVNLSGLKDVLERRADEELPVSSKWSVQNEGVWAKMSVAFDGETFPLRRNPNIDGYCKPYAQYVFKAGADVTPLVTLNNGEDTFVVAARKGNVVWLPEYLLMPFLFSKDTTANWAELRLDSFSSRILSVVMAQ